MTEWEQLAARYGPCPAPYITNESYRCDDCHEYNRGRLRHERRRARHKVVIVDMSRVAVEDGGDRHYQRCLHCHEQHEQRPSSTFGLINFGDCARRSETATLPLGSLAVSLHGARSLDGH